MNHNTPPPTPPCEGGEEARKSWEGGEEAKKPWEGGEEVREHCQQSRQSPVGQRLAYVAPVSLGEFFRQPLFFTGVVEREHAGGDEESKEQGTPLPASQSKDECAGDERTHETATAQRAASIADHADDEGEGKPAQEFKEVE